MTIAPRNEPTSDEATPAADYSCTVESRQGYLHLSIRGENTAANVRRVRVRLFATVREAEAWLATLPPR
jgi:hypothetical protein